MHVTGSEEYNSLSNVSYLIVGLAGIVERYIAMRREGKGGGKVRA